MKSEELFEKARGLMPGGVNSPVRAFGAVGGTPRFITKGRGAVLTDVDGEKYIDYIGSWGPMILGHAHPDVVDAVQNVVKRGTSFGAPTELEIELAELVCGIFPSIEKIRMVNSGTEAAMGAIRAARGFTNRTKVIKFDGCYHGHADYLLVQAGSGAQTFGTPTSAGIPISITQETLVSKFNDMASVEKWFSQYPHGIAAVIVEPVVGNMGVIKPKPGFLEQLRDITERHGTLLIFDEVMTGFRLSLGGAQELYGIKPDLTCLGKILGGGFPVGAYGGRRDVMEKVAPEGPVYQAGTLSGNPVAMAAGIATLKILKEANPYQMLDSITTKLTDGLKDLVAKREIPVQVEQVGSMFTVFFTANIVMDADSARTTNTGSFAKFFHGLLKRGVMIPPSNFEACFVSVCHGDKEVEETLKAANGAFRDASKGP